MTDDARRSPDDIADTTATVDKIGTAAFPRFVRTVRGLAGANAACLSAFFDNACPVETHSTRTEPEALEALELYRDVAL